MTTGEEQPFARPPTRSRLDPRMRTALVSVGAFGALFALGAAGTWGLRGGLSVGAGALVAFLNLYGLTRILGGLVGARTDEPGDAGLWGVLAVVKICGLFGGVWLLMSSRIVDPLLLVGGWVALPVGIVVASLVSDKTDRMAPPHGKEAPPETPESTPRRPEIP